MFSDDEEALNSIMKDLAALGRCFTQQHGHKPKNRSVLYKQVGGLRHEATLHSKRTPTSTSDLPAGFKGLVVLRCKTQTSASLSLRFSCSVGADVTRFADADVTPGRSRTLAGMRILEWAK